MFEIVIFSVIVLAVSYWAVLWLMGRREDVLHGEFVEADAQSGEPVRATSSEPRIRPVFPDRPALSERPVLAERAALPEKPVQAAVPEPPAFRPERLEQLLASIKQDLNQLVQK